MPVIISTVAENMACHAGITRTKKLIAMAWATRMNRRETHMRRREAPFQVFQPLLHVSRIRATATAASRILGSGMNS